MIKLITFDLDNTLWDVSPVIRRADKVLKDWMADNTPEVLEHYTMETFLHIKNQVAEENPEKLQLPTFFRKALLAYSYEQTGLAGDTLDQRVEEAFAVFHKARNEIDFFPETIPLLQKLSQDFELIALSNGNADLDMVGLSEYFSAHFSADSTGKPKPDPTMFLAALEHAKVKPEQAIHIGDHQQEDVEAARTLGFKTIWFNEDGQQTNKNCSPDREVTRLSEIYGAMTSLMC